jgi:hypothetical protein
MAEPFYFGGHSEAVPNVSGPFNPDRNTVQDVSAVEKQQDEEDTAGTELRKTAAGPAADPDLGKEASSAVHEVCQTLPAPQRIPKLGQSLVS